VADVHFLSLVATPTQASIAVVIRMHWPADGSSADLELGVPGPRITAPAATELPAPWASVIAQRLAAGRHQEAFTPLATILEDIEGTRFALAGLSVAAGESYLHVAASGGPELTERFTRPWYPWFSWWVRDSAGDWHVAVIAEPSARSAGETSFRLRLVPPLAGGQDTIEVVVTGASARIRAVVPLRKCRTIKP
jgi:hypothetical protein